MHEMQAARKTTHQPARLLAMHASPSPPLDDDFFCNWFILSTTE